MAQSEKPKRYIFNKVIINYTKVRIKTSAPLYLSINPVMEICI